MATTTPSLVLLFVIGRLPPRSSSSLLLLLLFLFLLEADPRCEERDECASVVDDDEGTFVLAAFLLNESSIDANSLMIDDPLSFYVIDVCLHCNLQHNRVVRTKMAGTIVSPNNVTRLHAIIIAIKTLSKSSSGGNNMH